MSWPPSYRFYSLPQLLVRSSAELHRLAELYDCLATLLRGDRILYSLGEPCIAVDLPFLSDVEMLRWATAVLHWHRAPSEEQATAHRELRALENRLGSVTQARANAALTALCARMFHSVEQRQQVLPAFKGVIDQRAWGQISAEGALVALLAVVEEHLQCAESEIAPDDTNHHASELAN